MFTEEHKKLVEEGEKWMKKTASSCSVVTTVVITVVFAAAFTVPGGNNNGGIPNFLHEQTFLIFAVPYALALFSSTTSLLTFLSILTSRYSEEDFLESLPKKLIMGPINYVVPFYCKHDDSFCCNNLYCFISSIEVGYYCSGSTWLSTSHLIGKVTVSSFG